MSKQEVSHSGIVQEVIGNTVKVSIISKTNCVSCQMNKSCSTSDTKEKIIEIENFEGVYNVGENVNVSLKESTGFKALFLGYVLPFLILFLTLITTSKFINNELYVGLISLSTLIPYYLSIFLLKDIIKKEFSFFVHKQI